MYRLWGAVFLTLLVLAGAGSMAAKAVEQTPAFGFVGAEIQPVSLTEAQALGMAAPRGVFVRDLVTWGPAYRAGLRRGDVVLDYAGVPVTGLQHLIGLVQGSRPGDRVSIVRRRLGQEDSLSLILSAYPPGWSVRTESASVVPRLGLTLAALTPKVRERAGLRWGARGLVITDVAAGSEAARLGLIPGEVLVAADGVRLVDPATAERALLDAALVVVEGRRGFRALIVDASAPPLPPSVMAAGVSWQAVPGQGVLVLDVAHRTSGAEAGLRTGDLVTHVDGVSALDSEAVAALALTPVTATVVGLEDAAPRRVDWSPEPAATLAETVQVVPVLGGAVASLSPSLRDSFALRPVSRGTVVTSVAADGRAAEAGLRPGLIIVAVNQRFVDHPREVEDELADALARKAAEAVLLIEGPQGYRIVGLPLTAAERSPPPSPGLLQWQGEAAE